MTPKETVTDPEMCHMFLIHNDSAVHNVFGPVTVRFVTTRIALDRVYHERDRVLGRDQFLGEIPTATHVEMYTKRVYLSGPGEGGNDWVFQNSWMAPLSREQAFIKKYGQVG